MDGQPTYRELIEQGFHAVHTRIDDLRSEILDARDSDREESRRMHAENTAQLQRINGKVNRAHEFIAELKVTSATLTAEFQAIRTRWHQFRESVQAGLQTALSQLRNGNSTASSDERPITRKELGWVIALIVGCITIGAVVTIWILKVAQP